MSELILVRHGQASFGGENYDQLSKVGYQQSQLLGEYFSERSISFDLLIAGNMQRHQQTLDGICEGMNIDKELPYRTHSGFDEYDFAAIATSYSCFKPADKLVQLCAERPNDMKSFLRLLRRALTSWSQGELDEVPETWQEFRNRVENARTMLHGLSTSAKRILVASSGGAISQFIGLVLGLSPEKVFDLNLQLKNTGVSQFYFNDQIINLSCFNSVTHLDYAQHEALIT